MKEVLPQTLEQKKKPFQGQGGNMGNNPSTHLTIKQRTQEAA